MLRALVTQKETSGDIIGSEQQEPQGFLQQAGSDLDVMIRHKIRLTPSGALSSAAIVCVTALPEPNVHKH